jgi:hypothetical protein
MKAQEGREIGDERGQGDAKVRTFFMIPAFRLEKVMWRRDLS